MQALNWSKGNRLACAVLGSSMNKYYIHVNKISTIELRVSILYTVVTVQ